MAGEDRNGPMVQSTKAIGLITKLKAKESSLTPTTITMREIGLMIRPMDMELMFTVRLELDMKVTGKMICNMDRECKYTVMETSMRECLNKEKEMAKEPITMLLAKFTREVG